MPAYLLMRAKITDTYIVLPIPADLFKEIAARVIDRGTADPAMLNRVRELDSQVSLDSNPVLLVGSLN